MELIIIKSENKYIRTTNGNYEITGLDKASVFPMEKRDMVNRHRDALTDQGFKNVHLKKLVITEEDFD